MNRSIFIVIVDFLLLSLITFARFDSDQDLTARKGGQLSQKDSPTQKEMLGALKLSLEDERQNRERIVEQLTQTQDSLRARDQELADREKRIQESQLSLQRKNEEAQKLAAERAALRKEIDQAQSTLSSLSTKLESTSSEAKAAKERIRTVEADLLQRQEELNRASVEAKFSKERLSTMEADLRKRQDEIIRASTDAEVSKDRLALMEAELRKRQEETAQAQKALAEKDKERLSAEAEKQKLASQLKLTEAEKRMTLDELQRSRQEKAKLAEQTGKLATGVTSLAEKTEDLTTEIRQNRPLAPNSIYSDFQTNRIQTFVQASRHGVFGQAVDKQKESKTVLVQQGSNTFAILHIDDTPLSIGDPGLDWQRVSGHLRKGVETASITQLSFWGSDPRVVIIPVSPAWAARWGVKIYAISDEPFKFQEAVLVGGAENYYGECGFQIDPKNPRYVRMDRNIFKRMVGNFAPSGGDLVFSKTGQVIGVMVNKEYCAILNNFSSFFNIQAGPSVAPQQTSAILSAMFRQITALPLRLQ